MNTRRLILAFVALAMLTAAGCATSVPVVPHALRCDATPELLASKCAKPKPISDSSTFETVVTTMRDDRQALLECGLMLDSLRDSLNRCNQQADEFNKKIDSISKVHNY